MSSALTFNKKVFFSLALLLSTAPRLYGAETKPQALSQSNSSHWAVSADFLAWYASEEEASIWADVITVGDNTSSWKAPGFNFKWDYGFRLGIGYDLIRDQWDTTLNWTWFRTEAKHTIPSQPNTRISPEFFAAFLSGDIPESMRAKWSLLFNMFDWELGRRCRLSKGLSLRPFLGLKGGWIHQSIHAHYSNLTIANVPTHNTAREHLKNNFWGIGPLGGVKTQWELRNFKTHFFSFFGDFSMATLWGTWNNDDFYKNTAAQESTVNTKKSSQGALMFQGFLGAGWQVAFHKDRSHFAVKLGYEMQIWLNQLRIATFQLQRLHDDLTLQGVTVNFRCDF